MQRNENNIGESGKTSVKVHHQPGGQSSFSLGWGADDKSKPSIFFIIKFKSITTKAMWSLEVLMKSKMRKKRKELKNKKERKRNS